MDTQLLVTAVLDESWIVTIHDEVDALPDSEPDFMLPYYVGKLDAEMGLDSQPNEYYARLGDIAEYERGWQEARLQMETGINAAAELEELSEGMEETDWLFGWQR